MVNINRKSSIKIFTNIEMKKYYILLFILAFISCKKQLLYNNIVFKYNCSVPEQLSFQLQSKKLLTDSVFNADIQDRSIMQRLNPETIMQLLQFGNKVFDDDICDTLPPAYFENTSCYIYGKLDLQPYVKSVVVWELTIDQTMDINYRKLWLFNIKDEKLCSVVLLDSRSSSWIDTPPPKTYFKEKLFTCRYDEYAYDDFFWKNFGNWLHGGTNNKISYYSHYKINKDGFVEFIEK